jgi:hypothetical protein
VEGKSHIVRVMDGGCHRGKLPVIISENPPKRAGCSLLNGTIEVSGTGRWNMVLRQKWIRMKERSMLLPLQLGRQ